MRAEFNKTNLSPSTGDSGSFVGYKSLGRRPQKSVCDYVDACPACLADSPFKVPVSENDWLYFQFHMVDHVNENPDEPVYGWDEGSPSGDSWITASIEFGNLPELSLVGNSIVLSEWVGWFQGSFQNLVLDSNAILQHIQNNDLEKDCFRIKITTYRNEIEDFTSVVGIGFTGSVPPIQTWWEPGDYIIIGDAIYVLGELHGSFTYVRDVIPGELFFNEVNGGWYRYNPETIEKPWQRVDDIYERVVYEVCYTYWHKFIDCEQTVVVRGDFETGDCQGNYYGSDPNNILNFAHQDLYRIEATLEMQRIFQEREVNENEQVTQLKQFEEYLLRSTVNFPQGIVRRIANTFTAPRFFFNSILYINPSEVARRIETGNYWWIAPTVQRLACEITSDCIDEFSWTPPGEPKALCKTAKVVNSNLTFLVSVPSGTMYVLEDNTYNVYMEGVLVASQTGPSMVDQTININWT